MSFNVTLHSNAWAPSGIRTNGLDGFKCVLYVSYFHTRISTATHRISTSKPSHLRSRFPSASVHRGGEANRNLYCSSQVVASWLAPRCLWTQMNWARHSCPGVGTIKAETSALSQVFPSLYTCWEPSSSRNKSGSISCHCLVGEPPYLIPTPRALYVCIVGPAIIYTEGECGSGGGRDSA